MKYDVVIMAELDWNGLHSQSHAMANYFCEEGHKVWYINRTLQRFPRWKHLMMRFSGSAKYGNLSETQRPVPPGLRIVNLWVGPPYRWLRWLNRIMIKRAFKNAGIRNPLFITYIPTYNCIDTRNFLKPFKSAYVCYHNFDADVVLNDVRKAEREIILSTDVLFADSLFLVDRLKKLSGGKMIYQAPPGVYFNLFKQAYRGDEAKTRKTICFFGGAGKHLNLEVYNRLAKSYDVLFIAVISEEIKDLLDPGIRVVSPVANHLLPDLLKEVDVLTILYIKSDYINGVIPAKLFECIATGKPVLVSGLDETKPYNHVVYDIQGSSDRALEILSNLEKTHTPERIELQFAEGLKADFRSRYESFKKNLNINPGING